MTSLPCPRATYRLQFNGGFTFSHAARIVPYLDTLGVSHCYASPYLKARRGSPHGYDIVDHNALNPEIGADDEFEAFCSALTDRNMGQILDLVPNHMGVGGHDNVWWLDVLEHGPASPYAEYFDIEWQPVKDELRGKILLPVLGAHYGSTLENGELSLKFDSDAGSLSVWYYEHRFPLDPQTYPLVLALGLDRLSASASAGTVPVRDYRELIRRCESLPSRSDTADGAAQRRLRDAQACKDRLRDLCRASDELRKFVEANVGQLNGTTDSAASFDGLHALLEHQAYRLAYWQVASDEINYRRFFDINDLAALRMENPEVFDATHAFPLQLLRSGKIHGLRIDHPDGLSDPLAYYRRLQRNTVGAPEGERPAYIVVEKILATYERLPAEWPVHGTTGYEFGHLVNGLFVDPASQRELDSIYKRFAGDALDFDELLYERKKLLIRVQLSSELTVLSTLFDRLAQAERHTRDFTLNGLREALVEVVACFPVYRTYVTRGHVSDDDQRFIQWAVAQAKKKSPAADISIFDFIADVLLLRQPERVPSTYVVKALYAVRRFQQYTAPVMAKALEDTAMYIYNRLVSLNEVGSDPRRYGVSPAAFHLANQERLESWPSSMLNTSTHDSKRSEDVRARLNVLSEIPGEWRHHLGRWTRLNRKKKRLADRAPAPVRNDEYLLYQTLIGSWPLEPMDEDQLADYRERIESYMTKAIKEAKVHTSWINPNTEYEQATRAFVRDLLSDLHGNPFVTDFLALQERVARFGLYTSLSQTLLKLTVPGVPDIYQGSELWQFALVDPDNRRPVDYGWRMGLLDGLRAQRSEQDPAIVAEGLIRAPEDGCAKLLVTWQCLEARRRHPELFQSGDYLPLSANGARAEHVCAFARQLNGHVAVIVAPRWFARLLDGEHTRLPLGPGVWQDTTVELPAGLPNGPYTECFTDQSITTTHDGEVHALRLGALLNRFPVALLLGSGG